MVCLTEVPIEGVPLFLGNWVFSHSPCHFPEIWIHDSPFSHNTYMYSYKISSHSLTDVCYKTCNSTYRTSSWETPRRAPSTAAVPPSPVSCSVTLVSGSDLSAHQCQSQLDSPGGFLCERGWGSGHKTTIPFGPLYLAMMPIARTR